MPVAAGGDAFGDVVAAWGTPEILGRLEAMRMLLMQADRRVECQTRCPKRPAVWKPNQQTLCGVFQGLQWNSS